MIIVVMFDNVGGFGCRYFNLPSSHAAAIRRLEPHIPISNQEAELPLGCEGLYVVSRHVSEFAWTWIGSYKPVPRKIKARDGDFCGIGFWLSTIEIPGTYLDAVLNSLTERLERLMARADGWTTDVFDWGEIGIDTALISRLDKQSRPLTPGTGIDFEQFEATAAFDHRDGTGQPYVACALDRSQAGAGLRALSRVLIPRDDETSLHIRLQGPRLGAENDAGSPYDLPTQAPQSPGERDAPVPALPLVPDEPVWSPCDGRSSLHSGPDPMRVVEKVRQDLEDRISHLEQSQDVARRQSRVTAMVTIAASLAVASSYAVFRSFEAPPEPPRITAIREASRDADPVPPSPSYPPSDAMRATTDPRLPPAADPSDPYARLDTSVATIAGLLMEGSTVVGSDDARRRLQKTFQGFVDLLQQSPEPRIKAIGDRVRPSPIEPGRPKFRN